MRGHSALLSASVERWKPETHTFHLSVAIFLVSRLMGRPLRVDQIAVTSFWWKTALRVLVGSPIRKITCWGRLILLGSGGAETPRNGERFNLNTRPWHLQCHCFQPYWQSLVRNFPITENFCDSFLLCQPSLAAVTHSVVEPALNFCNNRLHLYRGVCFDQRPNGICNCV
ncbi:hypothetical protein AHAS_Ahas11G0091000 [Arachis hypogaea]